MPVSLVRVPGAFSAEPELRRRAMAAARKLAPEEERRLRASEVQNAVSLRGAQQSSGLSEMPGASGTVAEVGAPAVGARSGAPGAATEVATVAPAPPAAAAAATATVQGGFDGLSLSVPPSAASAGAVAALSQEGREVGRGGRSERVSREAEIGAAREAAAVFASGGSGGGGGGVGAAGEGAGCENGELRRRRVKVAPGVLAFLTKEYSDRALTASVVVKRTAGGESRPVAPPATVADGCLLSGAPGDGMEVPPPPPPPSAIVRPPAAKPLSKSLAALLAKNAIDNGSGELARGGGGRVSGGGGKRSASASPLGFLDELKARAKANAGQALATGDADGDGGGTEGAGVAMDGAGEQVSIGGGLARVSGKETTVVARGGGSFLDELRARTARIS